jgi:hypothetical protein
LSLKGAHPGNARSVEASLARETGTAIGFDTGNPLRNGVLTDAGFALRIGERDFTRNIASFSFGVFRRGSRTW